MSKRADLRKVGNAASLVTPARHIPKLVKVLAPIGVITMLFDNIPQDSLYAMIIAIVATAVVILAVNYLAEYRDWKYEKQLEYEEALNKLGKDAKKPVLSFSILYGLSMAVSLILVGLIAAFTVPLAVKFFVYDPELAVEPATYFFIAVLVTAVLALFVDKLICRPIIDGTFKAKESAAEDLIIADLEAKFQAGAVAGLTPETQAKLINAFSEVLRQQSKKN